MNKHNVIKTVYEMKSISCAANKLNYTQSAVSQIIKSFEKEIGMKLFKRSKNGVELVAGTEEIMNRVIEICNLENEIQSISSEITSLDNGCLRIGTIQSVAYNLLPDILDNFSNEYPNISFDIKIDRFDELIKMVKSNLLDVIFVSEYSVPDMNFNKIMTDELVLVTPLNDDLAKNITVSIDEINKKPFILSADGLNYETGIIFKRNGINPDIKYRVNEDFTVIKLVEYGFGISILPKLLLAKTPFSVCIRNFNENYFRNIGIAYMDKNYISPIAKTFIEYINRIY